MSIKSSLINRDAVQDFLDMDNFEAGPASKGEYIQVDAQAEWDNFLSIIKQ